MHLVARWAPAIRTDAFVVRLAAPVLAACLAVGAVAGQETGDGATGVVEGAVTSARGSGARALPGAWIEVAGRPGLTALTGTDGRYRIASAPAGRGRLRIRALGYRPLELDVSVPPRDTLHLDLVLEPEPLRVQGVAVRADPVVARLAPSDPAPDRRATMEPRVLDTGPGLAEAGLGSVARGLPDDGGSDPNRVLLMRGSTADEKLVLLDGAPVYVPFHLGGLVPSFEPGLLSSARHYVGGAPARYDGGLSYVLDLRTRPGTDELRSSAFLDQLSGGATLEGPVGGSGSLLLSGRALHDGVAPFLSEGASPYGYGDLLVRGDLRLDPGHRIAATAFWNRERVPLDAAPDEGNAEAASTETPLARRLVRPEAARWGNGAVSLRYRGKGAAGEVEVTVAGSRYDAALPLAHETPAAGRARTDRIRVSAELGRSGDDGALRLGVSAEGIDHARSGRVLVSDSVDGDSVVEVRDRSRTGAVSVYVDGSRSVSRSVRLRGGLRLDRFSRGGGLKVAPRLALTWLLTDQATLTLAAGRFHQLPRGGELEVRMARGDPGGLETGQAVYPPARADHVVLTLDQELSSSLRMGLEGFVKGFRDLPGATDVLRSSGMDLRIRRESEELSGWLGYSLSWFWNPGSGGGPGSAAAFAGRHLLTAGAEGRLLPFLDASARLAYGDGLPYTSVPFADGTAEGRTLTGVVQTSGGVAGEGSSDVHDRIPTLDGFFRLDLEVRGDWTVDWAGRSISLRPYVRVMNALSRRDALFYYFEPWRDDELRALAERPVLPVMGLDVRIGGPSRR